MDIGFIGLRATVPASTVTLSFTWPSSSVEVLAAHDVDRDEDVALRERAKSLGVDGQVIGSGRQRRKRVAARRRW